MSDSDEERRIEKRLAEDRRTGELGIRVRLRQNRIHLEGVVHSDARREAACAVARETTQLEVVDDLAVTAEHPPSPPATEDL